LRAVIGKFETDKPIFLLGDGDINFSKFPNRVIFYADSEIENLIRSNGLKIVIFDFFVEMTEIPIFDFEAL
jgi:hypothetical protein